MRTYKDLENRVGIMEFQKGSKSQRIHAFIEKKLGYFTKSDISNAKWKRLLKRKYCTVKIELILRYSIFVKY